MAQVSKERKTAASTVLQKIRTSHPRASRVPDAVFAVIILLSAISVFAIVVLVAWELIDKSRLSLHQFGIGFFYGHDWDPVAGSFGAMPFIYGTLVSSFLALLMAVPLSIGVAVYVTEMCPQRLRAIISFLVELLAAIPSVIYGLWGIFVLAPLLREYVEPFLARTLGWTGLFTGPMYGLGMLAAGIIMAIMVVPVIASITREVMTAVPQNQREAVLALGATRWEMIRMGVLRNARIGIVGGIILGLGRALGETMAVTMVIGNRPEIAKSLFAPGYTMASVIANEFTEATGDLYLSAGGDRAGAVYRDAHRQRPGPAAGVEHHWRDCEGACLICPPSQLRSRSAWYAVLPTQARPPSRLRPPSWCWFRCWPSSLTWSSRESAPSIGLSLRRRRNLRARWAAAWPMPSLAPESSWRWPASSECPWASARAFTWRNMAAIALVTWCDLPPTCSMVCRRSLSALPPIRW
jgi:phosphate transport system permease protein